MAQVTLPERICFWLIVLTWPIYFVGGLYLASPLIGWALLVLLVLGKYLEEAVRSDLVYADSAPALVWIWTIGMLTMLFALWVGHWNWDLDLATTVKSSIGWAKGWALIALFIAVGAMMPIRRLVIVRAQNIVGLCTILLLPVFLVAPTLGLPSLLFVSPTSIIGGPGPEYFSVYLYTIDPASMATRIQFYAPWSPFAGLLGVNMAVMAIEDKKIFWKVCGLLGACSMVYFSKSRMSLVALVLCILLPVLMPQLKKQISWILFAGCASFFAIFGALLSETLSNLLDGFRNARKSSSRVRDAIQSIAFQRWQNEAIWFGHGTVTRGPHIVEYMPIGSHHTWYGLLFVKGAVGFLALLIPMVIHLVLIIRDAVSVSRARLPMAIFLNLILLTFGENLEIEAYLLWPGLVILGIHLREMSQEERPHSVLRTGPQHPKV